MYVEAITHDLNNASEDWSECLKQLPLPSSSSQSPDVTALHVTPTPNPVPCTPSVGMEATRRWMHTRLTYLIRTLSSDLPDGDKLLRRLLLEYVNWERPEARGWSPEENA